MPDSTGQQAGGGAADRARQLLATPVVTDQDVLDRVTALIGPEAGHGQNRTLWLLFLDAQGTQADLAVPVDGLPERPHALVIGNICHVVSEALARGSPGSSVVITLSRPGTTSLTSSDRYLLCTLQRGTSKYRTPVRMLCLATPGGTRQLGPASPAAGTPPGLPEPGM